MLGDFRKIIKKGEKYIMVENGRPEYVVMHYDDYAELIDRNGASDLSAEAPGAKAGALAKEEDFNADAIFASPNLPEDLSKIRLEDLPL